MKKIIFAMILSCFCAAGTVVDAKVFTRCRFRSGWILAAETSKNCPDIKNMNKYFKNSLPKNQAYALLVFKLDKKRKVTVHDYSLEKDGKTFKCIALGEAHCDFDARKIISNGVEERLYAMLFAIDKSQLDSGKYTKYNLHYNLSNFGHTDIKIKFLNREGDFTKTSLTPEQGSLQFKL